MVLKNNKRNLTINIVHLADTVCVNNEDDNNE